MAMRKRGLAPGGINMYARTINSYLSWLHEEGHLAEKLKVKLLRNNPKPIRALTDTDIKRRVFLRPKGRIETRSWTLCLVLLDTGLRIDEALGLLRSNVDPDNLTLRVTGKGSKELLVPISNECRKQLYRLLSKSRVQVGLHNETGSQSALPQRLPGHRGALSKGRNQQPRPSHALRHCFLVNYIRKGGDIYRLSRILGHSSISTTQLYLRSMGIEHLKEGHLSPLTH